MHLSVQLLRARQVALVASYVLDRVLSLSVRVVIDVDADSLLIAFIIWVLAFPFLILLRLQKCILVVILLVLMIFGIDSEIRCCSLIIVVASLLLLRRKAILIKIMTHQKLLVTELAIQPSVHMTPFLALIVQLLSLPLPINFDPLLYLLQMLFGIVAHLLLRPLQL